MTNWKEYKLGELVAINERSIGRNFEFKAIEYIDTSSVTENKFDTPTYTTISEAPSRAKRLIANGDTIISTVRPIQKHYGFIKEAKGNQIVSTGFAVVTPKSIEARYLYYFLTQAEITEFLNTIAEGGTTTFPAFKADELKDLPINLPDYKTQTAIAEILSSLDDKIELNNKINQELENLAQTLFKQWFIDFEFPNENGDPYKSAGGEMVDSELGEIPKGWEVGDISKIGTNIRDNIKPEQFNYSLKYIGLEHVPRKSLTITNWGNSTDVDSIKSAFKKGDILFGKLRPYFHKVITPPFNGICSTDILVFRPKNVFEFGFLLLHLFSTEIVEYATNVSGGTRMPRVSWSDISKYPICIPPRLILSDFNHQIMEIIQKIYSNILENQELTNLRDTLLPKLISGELEVAEV